MNPATRALLRNAVIEAVSNEQDASAVELLALLSGDQPSHLPSAAVPIVKAAQLMLPSDRPVIDGPARDYHYWAAFIRKNFIPFMVANGRPRFTSGELFSWIDNHLDVCMTAGDIEPRCDGKQYWRNIVSDALRSLKQQGLVEAQKGARVYVIPNQLMGEIRSLNLAP